MAHLRVTRLTPAKGRRRVEMTIPAMKAELIQAALAAGSDPSSDAAATTNGMRWTGSDEAADKTLAPAIHAGGQEDLFMVP